MPMLTWMPSVLRAAGLPVREVPGWQTRGHGAMGAVAGVLAHHTAGSARGLYPSEDVVVHGRPGLAGPLANLGVDRAGTWIVVAAGQAWHAGTGSASWCPAGQGNSRLIGVEAESVGTRDDWTREQRESYPRGVAALLRHLGLGSYRVLGHKEWAPGRKIDPAFWDMTSFRADVARWMSTTPRPAPVQEDDMFTDQDRALLHTLARRDDVGHVRNQVLTALGVDDPIAAPTSRKPADNAGIAVARRVDVGHARDQIVARLDELLALVRAAGVDPAAVTAALTSALGGGLVISGTATPAKAEQR